MQDETKICPYTKENFTPRRTNQIFLNSSARIKFNNAKAGLLRKGKAPVDRTLAQNRKIITELLNGSREVVKTKDFLLGAGFDFSKMTHGKNLEDGVQLICIYDTGYVKLSDMAYKLMQI